MIADSLTFVSFCSNPCTCRLITFVASRSGGWALPTPQFPSLQCSRFLGYDWVVDLALAGHRCRSWVDGGRRLTRSRWNFHAKGGAAWLLDLDHGDHRASWRAEPDMVRTPPNARSARPIRSPLPRRIHPGHLPPDLPRHPLHQRENDRRRHLRSGSVLGLAGTEGDLPRQRPRSHLPSRPVGHVVAGTRGSHQDRLPRTPRRHHDDGP